MIILIINISINMHNILRIIYPVYLYSLNKIYAPKGSIYRDCIDFKIFIIQFQLYYNNIYNIFLRNYNPFRLFE